MRTVLLVLLALAAPAAAEPVRSGFMIGASLGAGGATACRDACDRLAGGAAEIHIGAWLTPNWGLSYETWVYTGDPTSLAMSGTGASLATVTTRLAPRIWIKGGAGLAMYTHDDPITQQITNQNMSFTYRGVGLGAGAGYELYQSSGSIVIDASVRTVVGLYPDHGANMAGSALIGVSWN